MSYSAYLLSQPFKLPTGTVALLAGLAYVKVYLLQPPVLWQEISKAEWNATPKNYLQNPEHHAAAFPKVPGIKNIPDGRAELAHKLHPHAAHH